LDFLELLVFLEVLLVETVILLSLELLLFVTWNLVGGGMMVDKLLGIGDSCCGEKVG